MKRTMTLAVLCLLLWGAPAAADSFRERTIRGESSHPNRAIPADGPWYRLALCESSNHNDRGPRFYGFFNFDRRTFRSNGGTGLASDHPYLEQLRVAKVLQSRRGWSPWPRCSKRLRLR